MSAIELLQQKGRGHIVFVCLGNICRSPLAEGIAKHLYQGDMYSFSSAGTSGFHSGDSIDERSITIAHKNGIDISGYKSKQISIYKHTQADLLVAMDKSVLTTLHQLGFDHKKIILFGDFGLGGAEVPDPYYGGAQGFENVYAMLFSGINYLLKELLCNKL